MQIFGVGGAELILIILIMLVVAGPQRMIRWAYFLGKWVATFRNIWSQMVDGIEKEMRESGMDVNLPRDLPNRQNISQWTNEAIKPYKDELDKEFESVRNPIKQTADETNAMLQSTADELEKDMKPRRQFRQPDGGTVAVGKTTQPSTEPVDTPAAESPAAESPAAESPAAESPAAESPPVKTDTGLGAWANPQHPSQQTTQANGREA